MSSNGKSSFGDRLRGLFGSPPSPREAHEVPAPKNDDGDMHVAHINSRLDFTDAAKIARTLMRLHRDSGLGVSALVAGNNGGDSRGVHEFQPGPDKDMEDFILAEGLLDYQFQTSHTLYKHKVVKGADVLHLHNLHGGYFNPFSLPGLTLHHPCVWTLHDMHALTGHCSQALACERWQTGCGACPDLGAYPQVRADNTNRVWIDRKNIYESSGFHLVASSRWLASLVEKSLLSDVALDVIPNGVDTAVFTPKDKAEARARLGLPVDALIVGNAAAGGDRRDNPLRGGRFAVKALRELRKEHDEAVFLGMGGSGASAENGLQIMSGVKDERHLADVYRALDFLLYPSIADTCPLMVLEAMACGVPVAVFGVGGIPEIVQDGVSGLVVAEGDGEGMTKAVLCLAEYPELRRKFGDNASSIAASRYNAALMADAYLALYERVRKDFPHGLYAGRRLKRSEVPDCVKTPVFTAAAEELSLLEDDGF